LSETLLNCSHITRELHRRSPQISTMTSVASEYHNNVALGWPVTAPQSMIRSNLKYLELELRVTSGLPA
jgi:hypothetical protein